MSSTLLRIEKCVFYVKRQSIAYEENIGNIYDRHRIISDVEIYYIYIYMSSHICIHMANQNMKICSTLLVIEEIQMKIRCHFSVYRLTTFKKFS